MAFTSEELTILGIFLWDRTRHFVGSNHLVVGYDDRILDITTNSRASPEIDTAVD